MDKIAIVFRVKELLPTQPQIVFAHTGDEPRLCARWLSRGGSRVATSRL